MPKPLLLPILFSLPILAFAQLPNYFAEGSRWVYETSESWEPGQPFQSSQTEQNLIHGDTLIGNVLYRKLYTTVHASNTAYLPFPQPPITTFSQGRSGPTFIRFDSAENKVYYRPGPDSTERIIYDFKLQVGDFLPMQPAIFSPGRVDSIENVSLFGNPVKKFYTTESTGGAVYEENYILEGMGGSNGLAYFQPMALLVSGGLFTTSLICFQSGDSIYTPHKGDCPFLEFVSTKDAVKETMEVLISPNPTKGAFTLSVDEGTLPATFTVLDYLGRRVYSSELTEPVTFGQLPATGIYFWTLEIAGRIVKAGKLICN